MVHKEIKESEAWAGEATVGCWGHTPEGWGQDRKYTKVENRQRYTHFRTSKSASKLCRIFNEKQAISSALN